MTLPLVLVLNGPNLDRLGTRQPEVYGRTTLGELEALLAGRGAGLGLAVECVQSKDADGLIRALAERRPAAVVINPASLTHHSFPLRDALAACGAPVWEVHLSNIHAREPFRRRSLVSPIARGVVCGFGPAGYIAALEAAAAWLAAVAKEGDG
ncbi:MAG: 3-dehydroquinate dehydratase [Acidobacteria bacterium]|nr:3-dehydroquinate dehydratase [Acidobacteriota bacterium]